MATILQIPGALSIAGNIPDIIIDSADSVNFKILIGADLQLEENYDPDANNRIHIRLKNILPSLLSVAIPTDNVFEQTAAVKTFIFDVGGTTSNHVVVAGGVDATVDALTFLKANWLTWQLQQKRVKYADPEWLSYYATEAVAVKVKAYFKEAEPVTITLDNLTSGKFYSLNVNFQYISGLFEGQPVYFDIWTEKAGPVRLSFIQRYVLMNDYFDSDDVFVFGNSVGGIDTIRFTGEKQEENKFDISSALFDEDNQDYDIDFGRVFKKNTGYFASDRERVWANEFFNSILRYLVTDDGLKAVTVSEATGKFLHGDPASVNYEFSFALSRQTKYLNFARAETLPEDVEIIDPDTEVFFLAPRLSEFPIATIDDLLIFPVQVPFLEQWKQISYAAIRDRIKNEILAEIPDLENEININENLVIVNKGTENAYLLSKIPFASARGLGSYIDENFPPTLWAGMPTASEDVKGGIKVGEGLQIIDGVLKALAQGGLVPSNGVELDLIFGSPGKYGYTESDTPTELGGPYMSFGSPLENNVAQIFFDETTNAFYYRVVSAGVAKPWIKLSTDAHTHDGRYYTETEINSALGLKADLENGKVPSNQLPSYVDDAVEYVSASNFPESGESGKIYVATDTNLTYRWTGTGYAEISQSIALGETSATAYRGDRGKTAYDHSQTAHNKAFVGLGNVDNTADVNKDVASAKKLVTTNYELAEDVNGNAIIKYQGAVHGKLVPANGKLNVLVSGGIGCYQTL
jgi:hypothetical protein